MPKKTMSPNSIKNLNMANQTSKLLTKEALEMALLMLLEEKTLAQITISELVTKAGVSRNAFYRHYKTKEDIITGRLTRLLRQTFQGLRQFNLRTQAQQAWTYLLAEAKQEAQLLRLIFHHKLQDFLTKRVAKRFRAYQRLSRKNNSSYASSFFSSAIIAMLDKWISDGMTVPIEEMAALGLPLLPQ